MKKPDEEYAIEITKVLLNLIRVHEVMLQQDAPDPRKKRSDNDIDFFYAKIDELSTSEEVRFTHILDRYSHHNGK